MKVLLIVAVLCLCLLHNLTSGCRSCFINGRTFAGDSFFNYTENCVYHRCSCACNGEYTCVNRTLDNCDVSSQQRAGSIGTRECKNCDVLGVLFPGGREFDYRRECRELTGCKCECDGSWKCRVDRNICQGGSSSSSSSSSYTYTSSSGQRTASGVSQGSRGGVLVGDISRSDCTPCNVNGRAVQPETTFQHTNGCITYNNCVCRCNGYWHCPAESGRNTCTGTSGGTIIGAEESGCRTCNVYGSIKVGGSQFTYRNNCEEWRGCRCNCDGSWDCSSATYNWVCQNICRKCTVNGTEYDGNSQFSYTSGCITYNPCQCNCDGSWNCPPESGKWTCTNQCTECQVDGSTYAGGSKFRLRRDCWEWDQCDCNCNGSWNCPKENARWVCQQRCLQCSVDNQNFEGGKPFQLQKGCWQFNCDCACDGSFNCPAERTVDTCRVNPATGCNYCSVHGKKFDGNTRFSHTDGCIEYKGCTCNCDGSWECPGRMAENKCDAQSSTRCSYCSINGERFEGNTRFQLTRDCWQAECDCRCDGSWQCSSSATYVCGDQHSQGACKDCMALGRRITSRSSFELSIGCIEYKCQCACDGSWQCPAGSAYSTCDLPPAHASVFQSFNIRSLSNYAHSWCRPCRINNSLFPGNSQFSYQDGCHTHYLRCYCDGGYRVASTIIDNCSEQIFSGAIAASESSSIFLSDTTTCRKCVVNGEEYAARSSFDIQVGCQVFRCQCTCKGLPMCQMGRDQLCGAVASVISTGAVSGGSVSGGSSSSGSSSRTVVVGGGSGTVTSSGGGGGTVTTTRGGGSGRSVTERRTVVVQGGGQTGTGTTTGGRRVVVVGGSGGGGGGSGTVVRRVISGGGGTDAGTVIRRVIQGGGTSRTVVDGGSGGTVVRRVITSGGTPSRTVVVRGGGGSVVRQGGSVVPGGSTTVVVGGGSQSGTCLSCVVDGRRYDGGTSFDYRRGCIRYRCQCNCRGFAMCRTVSLTDCYPNAECKPCEVEGRSYDANSRFTFEQDCNRVSCRCGCDGSAVCVRTPIPNCQQNQGCRDCVYDGVRRSVYERFYIDNTCERTLCQCECNGQVRCSAPVRTCVDPNPNSACMGCTLNGVYYKGGSSFDFVHGPWKFPCTCDCNGRYSCDRSRAVYLEDEEAEERCKTCEVDGRSYPGDSKFTRQQQCYEYRCQCNCDGSYDCVSSGVYICGAAGRGQTITSGGSQSGGNARTGTRTTTVTETRNTTTSRTTGGSTNTGGSSTRTSTNTGGSSTRTSTNTGGSSTRTGTQRNDCTACTIGSNTYPPEQAFYITRGCNRYKCQCYCTGRYGCRLAENVCDDQGRRTDRGSGTSSSSSTNTSSTSTDEGSSSSTSTRTSTSTSTRTRTTTRTEFTYETRQGSLVSDEAIDANGCRMCRAGNQRYRPNSEFELDDGCKRFRCRCNCDGSWECPNQIPRNTCSSSGGDSNCQQCRVRGGTYEPNQSFILKYDECRSLRCDCKCDGQYTCGRDIINTCQDQTCKNCVVDGRSYPPNREFSYEDATYRYSCLCSCDGSYNCPAERTQLRPGACQNCQRGGQSYPPNQSFSYRDGEYQFSCDCNCDGSYNCPSARTRKIAPDAIAGITGNSRAQQVITSTSTSEEVVSSSQTVSASGDVKQGGNRRSFFAESSRTRSGVASPSGKIFAGTACRYCAVRGREYPPNRRFQFDDNCWRFTCDCNCDGSFKCPASRTVDICARGQCRSCRRGKDEYPPNTVFEFDQRCFRYNCDCNCDGSYNCPASRTKDICTDQGRRCRVCSVRGREYQPNTRFQFEEDCHRHICDCNCDGSWQCPAERKVNICDDNDRRQSQCRECLAGGARRAPNSRFQYDEGCYRYSCTCNCDGSWNCPSEQTENICTDRQRPSRCQECVAGGARRAPNSRFQYDEGCYRYSCICNCDGSWNCPSEQTENICTDRQRPSRCQECVAGGARRAPNSRFQYEEGCYRYSCICNCDGSWNCPSEQTQNICTDQQRPSRCQECVAGGARRAPNSRFRYDDGCYRYECICNCDGSFNCPADRTINLCRSLESAAPLKSCVRCEVAGQSFAANSSFTYTEDCIESQCNCHCDGSFTCPKTTRKDICESARSQCKNCIIKGEEYRSNTDFSFIDGCDQMECHCRCDGSWHCPPSKTRNVCGNEATTCQPCHARGTDYPGNSTFVLADKCHEYKCQCGCDGRWSCPPEDTVNICDFEDRGDMGK